MAISLETMSAACFLSSSLSSRTESLVVATAAGALDCAGSKGPSPTRLVDGPRKPCAASPASSASVSASLSSNDSWLASSEARCPCSAAWSAPSLPSAAGELPAFPRLATGCSADGAAWRFAGLAKGAAGVAGVLAASPPAPPFASRALAVAIMSAILPGAGGTISPLVAGAVGGVGPADAAAERWADAASAGAGVLTRRDAADPVLLATPEACAPLAAEGAAVSGAATALLASAAVAGRSGALFMEWGVTACLAARATAGAPDTLGAADALAVPAGAFALAVAPLGVEALAAPALVVGSSLSAAAVVLGDGSAGPVAPAAEPAFLCALSGAFVDALFACGAAAGAAAAALAKDRPCVSISRRLLAMYLSKTPRMDACGSKGACGFLVWRARIFASNSLHMLLYRPSSVFSKMFDANICMAGGTRHCCQRRIFFLFFYETSGKKDAYLCRAAHVCVLEPGSLSHHLTIGECRFVTRLGRKNISQHGHAHGGMERLGEKASAFEANGLTGGAPRGSSASLPRARTRALLHQLLHTAFPPPYRALLDGVEQGNKPTKAWLCHSMILWKALRDEDAVAPAAILDLFRRFPAHGRTNQHCGHKRSGGMQHRALSSAHKGLRGGHVVDIVEMMDVVRHVKQQDAVRAGER